MSQTRNRRYEDFESPLDSWKRSEISHWTSTSFWSEDFLKARFDMSTFKSPRTPSKSSRIVDSTDEAKLDQSNLSHDSPRFEYSLQDLDCFLKDHPNNIHKESQQVCEKLLTSEQSTPTGTLFDDELFGKTMLAIDRQSEPSIVQYIGPTLIARVNELWIRGESNLPNDTLKEGMDELWLNCRPLTGITRPKPDYCVGFDVHAAFSQQHVDILLRLTGGSSKPSDYSATVGMIFPFLTVEAKTESMGGLDKADRQNAHSMFLAVRGITLFYQQAGLENELNYKIVAFSISYTHKGIRIYGHYPVTTGKRIQVYRHLIREYDIILDRWASYTFTKKVILDWAPAHLKNICSVLDKVTETGKSRLVEAMADTMADNSSIIAKLKQSDTSTGSPRRQTHSPTSTTEENPRKKLKTDKTIEPI
jgi:hypothetical protein